MLWAAAMGIKVGGLSRCTASTARRPTTKWGLVLRFSARMRAACGHETSSRLYSLFNKSSGGNTCEILYNYAWNLEFRSWFCANRGGAFLFLSKGNFYRSSIKRIFGSSSEKLETFKWSFPNTFSFISTWNLYSIQFLMNWKKFKIVKRSWN